MTRKEYSDWADYHRTLFGFGRDDDWEMLLSWYEVLESHSPEELRRASAAMAKAVAPACRFLRDHLFEIQRLVLTARAKRLPGEAADEATYSRCAHCDNTGRVIVPHPKSVQSGDWQPMMIAAIPNYYTLAVLCRCYAGRRIQSSLAGATVNYVTLDEYQRFNPHWKAQIAKRNQQLRTESKLAGFNPFKEIVREIQQRLGVAAGAREPGCDDVPNDQEMQHEEWSDQGD